MGLFGIGTYQSLSGGVTVGGGWPAVPFVLADPNAGVFGGTYGFVIDTRIKAPQQTEYIPAQEIGLDATGVSVVRGYPSITWSYTTMRPDYWYYLQQAYIQSGRTPPGFQYIVLIQYPAEDGSTVQILARMDPPTHSDRTVGSYNGVQLRFTYLGQATFSGQIQFLSS